MRNGVILQFQAVLACLFLDACTASGDDTPVLSTAGYGEIRFGDVLTDVEGRLAQWAQPAVMDLACHQTTFPRYPGVTFMVEGGVVTRADGDMGIANSAGIRIGDPIDRVMDAHPDILLTPHKYDAAGHYLVLNAAGGDAALVFEESGGVITEMRAGLKPSVEYVEGCL